MGVSGGGPGGVCETGGFSGEGGRISRSAVPVGGGGGGKEDIRLAVLPDRDLHHDLGPMVVAGRRFLEARVSSLRVP